MLFYQMAKLLKWQEREHKMMFVCHFVSLGHNMQHVD